jgi:D-glycero-D-manno-heptose 1,7-bisphosphate phosphatase
VAFDSFHICWHHPAGVVAELSGECECRKPAPGLLLAAARELGIDLERSWMIGDTDSDVFAGRAAGCRTVLIENPESAHKRGANAPAEVRVPTIDAAAETIAQRT